MEKSDLSTLAFQNLQPDQILTTMEDLGFECDGRLLTLNSYENRVYRIGINAGPPVVAKFYRPNHWTDQQILEEHAFAIELNSMEIPVIPPINISGKTLHRSGSFRLSVSPCHGGHAPELDNKDLMRQLGRLIGRIHLLGEKNSFNHRDHLYDDYYGIEAAQYIIKQAFIPSELKVVYQQITKELLGKVERAISEAGKTKEIRLHGDFHCGNVLVNKDQLHIVDLDDCRIGPAIQDIWMFLSGNADEQEPQLNNLLDGYTEFKEFNSRELLLIEALRSLRIIYYSGWLSRRWEDPAFKIAFPWFNTRRYWDDHILSLREQLAIMDEVPLCWRNH